MSSSAIENNRNRLKGQKKNRANKRLVGKRLEGTIAQKAAKEKIDGKREICRSEGVRVAQD